MKKLNFDENVKNILKKIKKVRNKIHFERTQKFDSSTEIFVKIYNYSKNV